MFTVKIPFGLEFAFDILLDFTFNEPMTLHATRWQNQHAWGLDACCACFLFCIAGSVKVEKRISGS